MELRWESGNRPGPFVCIALVLASVILFSWRVYILVTQRFQREYQRSLARQRSISPEEGSATHEKANINPKSGQQSDAIPAQQDVTGKARNEPASTSSVPDEMAAKALDSDLTAQRENQTPSENRKEAHEAEETATEKKKNISRNVIEGQTTNDVDSTPVMRGQKSPRKTRLDMLDELVSDVSSQADKDSLAEQEDAEQRSVVRQSSLAQSPGTRLRRASSEALLHEGVMSAARGDIDEVSEGSSSSESERLATAPAAEMPKSSPSSNEIPPSTITPNPEKEDETSTLKSGTYTPKVQEFVKATSDHPASDGHESREEGEISDEETSDEEKAGGVIRSDAEAERLKLLGNEKYTALAFEEAIDYYSKAIDACPRRSKSLAAILFCNMAAVHFSRESWEECIQCCSDSIELDPSFTKAYIRRARAYRASEKFGDAVADMKKALELDPSLTPTYQKELAALEVQANIQFEKEKEEMISKLKDFGNWALGKVGMSLDHFKVVQDPASGGYNIQYQPPEQTSQP